MFLFSQVPQESALSEHIRRATETDLVQIVELAEQRRLQYQAYQPVFWRNAPTAQQVHAPFLAKQLGNDEIIALVYQAGATVQGFVVASVRGGQACTIDDFCVINPQAWATVGRA